MTLQTYSITYST